MARILSQGETGTSVPQLTVDYFKRNAGVSDVYVTANSTQYRSTGGSGGQTTSYAYTWQGSTTQADQVTVTKPMITTAQNGPNSADTETTAYDSNGRPIWLKDGNGILTYIAYDSMTGAVIKQIVDVDTTQTTTFANKPSGWSTPGGAGAHLTTTYEVDSLGRTTKVTYPNGRIDYTVYNDATFEVRTYPAWDSTSNAPLLPITVTRQDKARGYTETLTMTATPTVSSGRPTGAESISSLQSLVRTAVNAAGQVISTDSYFNLSGVTYSASTLALGTAGTNYYHTEYGYDVEGNLTRTLSPTGTPDPGNLNPKSNVAHNIPGDDPTLTPFPYKRGVIITDDEYEKFIDVVNRDWTYWISQNCSSFASDVFYEVTGEDVDADDWFDVETPRELGRNIVINNSGKKDNVHESFWKYKHNLKKLPGTPGSSGGSSDGSRVFSPLY